MSDVAGKMTKLAWQLRESPQQALALLPVVPRVDQLKPGTDEAQAISHTLDVPFGAALSVLGEQLTSRMGETAQAFRYSRLARTDCPLTVSQLVGNSMYLSRFPRDDHDRLLAMRVASVLTYDARRTAFLKLTAAPQFSPLWDWYNRAAVTRTYLKDSDASVGFLETHLGPQSRYLEPYGLERFDTGYHTGLDRATEVISVLDRTMNGLELSSEDKAKVIHDTSGDVRRLCLELAKLQAPRSGGLAIALQGEDESLAKGYGQIFCYNTESFELANTSHSWSFNFAIPIGDYVMPAWFDDRQGQAIGADAFETSIGTGCPLVRFHAIERAVDASLVGATYTVWNGTNAHIPLTRWPLDAQRETRNASGPVAVPPPTGSLEQGL